MKTLFEQLGGTYTMQGEYRLPNLIVDETYTRLIGVWGQRRLHYLKHHRKVLYYNLLTSGKLYSHLADIEEQAQELFNRLITDLASKEGITEQLKSTDQMKWVQKMNNICERVTETVYSDVVFV
ncbi:MAG: TnpV protein [Fibrobacteraceae bacterium]|nr:TnpV protein [Fibrobacteraceae bacterium]